MNSKALIAIMVCFLFMGASLSGQSFWEDTPLPDMRNPDERVLFPNRMRTLTADLAGLDELLERSPQEAVTTVARSSHLIEIPRPDSGFDTFRIIEYSMMEPGLAERYPEFRTYKGVHHRDPRVRIRMQMTTRGFGAMVTGPEGRYFVDPFARNNTDQYISFFKHDYPAPETPFVCHVDDSDIPIERGESQRVSGDCVFRSYRFAVATTGEYANFHDAESEDDEAILMAEIVIAVNRVNDVYEHDVAVRLILIENAADVFYYDGATDPFTNGNLNQMINQNQSNMASVIGNSNYDVGHIFGTGGGGLAQLNVPCVNSSKARGGTALNSPIGDPFYIDYVSHEIGHQFGGRHTQNNSCNRDNTSSYEPGSASTIMGYAGICSPNVQDNSDDYFHGISVQQINNYVTDGNGDNCDTPISWTNSSPVVAAMDDYTIPRSTPFMLTADASDVDGDTLQYLWEQWDKEVGSMPPSSTNTVGPMFRSFHPDTSPTRTFPAMEEVINNMSPTWEVLPSIGRTMNFRATVFDFHESTASCSDEENMQVTTVAGAGPFLVTEPNDPTDIWASGETVEVTWNVAGTSSSPINCDNVDIFLSTDGGYTFTDTLALGESNDGSAMVEVPIVLTEEARVMVKGADNIFFDISDQDFEIIDPTPDYGMEVEPAFIELCEVLPSTQLDYTIRIASINGYSDNVNLAVSGIPPGASFFLGSNTVAPGDSTSLVLFKLSTAPFGSHEIVISGSSTSGNQQVSTILNIVDDMAVVTLASPEDGDESTSPTPTLTWNPEPTAATYYVELATDEAFTDIIVSEELNDTSYTVTESLVDTLTYYWRVRFGTSCGINPWSETFSFSPIDLVCLTYMADDVPVTIPDDSAGIFYSDMRIWEYGTVQDVNVIDLTGQHTWMEDVVIKIRNPGTTQAVTLFDMICDNDDDWDLNFDDEASSSSIPCPPTTGGTYIPDDQLSYFDGTQMRGGWRLETWDVYGPADGGQLDSWGIEVCVTNYGCNRTVYNAELAGPGSLAAALDCAVSGDTVDIWSGIATDTIVLPESLDLDFDLTILGPDEMNIAFDGSGLTRSATISSGVSVRIENIEIISGTATDGAAIENNGNLQLTNVTLSSGPAPPNGSLLNNLGSLVLKGDCRVNQ